MTDERILVFRMVVSMLRETYPETLGEIRAHDTEKGNLLLRKLHAILRSSGIEGDGRHEALTKLANRPIESANDLLFGEALAIFTEDDLMGLLDAIDQMGDIS